VRSLQDVDAVDLQQPGVPQHLSQVAPVGDDRTSRSVQPLGGDRDAARLSQ
jgi:hypothetical protein